MQGLRGTQSLTQGLEKPHMPPSMRIGLTIFSVMGFSYRRD
jgi:hypothetical protein